LPTFALILETSIELAEQASADLWGLGAAGVEVRDGEGTPMPGAAPPPGRALLVGWFEEAAEADRAAAALGGRVESVADQDWGEAWKKGLGPISVGRVFVRPSWVSVAPPEGAAEVVLDPGMAFGTGSHPSTALCLSALSDLLAGRSGASVLDVGTGSGLLAIAARKLGAGRVRGNDTDAVAVEVARENAARNGVEVELSAEPLACIDGQYDLIVANILANTLVELAPDVAAHLAPGGVAVVSGILGPQEGEVRAAYAAAGLAPDPAQDRCDQEWSLLAFRRERSP
jgi:ribosomal protein L11 methyltransferase